MSKVTPVDYDFTSIKSSLKSYLEGQSELADYDFDGSALSTFLDVLAYNTHFNALAVNFGLNETFLDSANIRNSIVSSAKLLGYTPRSIASAKAKVNIQINGFSGSAITIPEGTLLSTTIDGSSYSFSTSAAYTSNSSGLFSNVEITEGSKQTKTFIVNGTDTDHLFVLADDNIDTNTLKVSVKANSQSSAVDTFTRATKIVSLDQDSQVYFLQEGYDGYYEIYFGDGKLGKKLIGGNIVEVSYLRSNGKLANGAKVWTISNSINGHSDITVTNVTSASGGADREGIESIRFNAPLTYAAQDRAVTSNDYKNIIKSNYSDIETISVWGGEDHNPPTYGKVFISIKPESGEVLADTEKNNIKENILKSRNIVSVTPEFVDPDFTYLDLNIIFKYNPDTTSLSENTLKEEVKKKVLTNTTSFNETYLKKFDGIMRHSNLLATVDGTDGSILSSIVRVKMQKRLVIDSSPKYTINFPEAIYQSSLSVLSSTEFTYNGHICYLSDVIPAGGVGTRQIDICRNVDDVRVTVVESIDTLDPALGILTLENFSPTNYGSYVAITTIPNSYDIAPERNAILAIDSDRLTITGEIDTIASGSSVAGINYTTNSRF